MSARLEQRARPGMDLSDTVAVGKPSLQYASQDSLLEIVAC
jgi:hypothetical protein